MNLEVCYVLMFSQARLSQNQVPVQCFPNHVQVYISRLNRGVYLSLPIKSIGLCFFHDIAISAAYLRLVCKYDKYEEKREANKGESNPVETRLLVLLFSLLIHLISNCPNGRQNV